MTKYGSGGELRLLEADQPQSLHRYFKSWIFDRESPQGAGYLCE
jgi:hypothetical protein